jgi:hypothetical protein
MRRRDPWAWQRLESAESRGKWRKRNPRHREHTKGEYGRGKGSSYSRRLEAENESLRKRCEALLEQALGASEHCDVVFEFVDGDTSLSGHRAVLCAVSEVYEGMFRSGMVEAQKGKIRVPPGITVCSFRGFLEWLYLGGWCFSPQDDLAHSDTCALRLLLMQKYAA